MPKLLRIILTVVAASLVVVAVSSAAPPNMTQNIGGWARPHQAGDADGLNAYGFSPAPRTSNMIWVNDLAGPVGSLTTINGGANGDFSDYAFQGHYAFEAEYNNVVINDIDIPGSCQNAYMPCAPRAAVLPCAGSQGDVMVYGNLLMRAHEAPHAVPYGDLTRSCEVAGDEIQTVLLQGYDAPGDSFTLGWGAGTSIPIVRGANNTTAGISAALAGGNEQQVMTLASMDTNGDSFTLDFNGNTTIPFVRGTNYTNNAAGATAIAAALEGIAEVQTISLTNNTVDGRSYTLTYNGNNTVPIVRGQNNTQAGIQNALMGGNETQVVTLGSFNAATQSFQVDIAGNKSALIGLGGLAVSNANLQDAINAIPGFVGTATVTNAANTGFTVAFSGASANVNVSPISIFGCTGACTSSVRESARGGTAMTGWPANGTVAVGTVADGGYTLTFGGAHMGTNVAALTVTNGTGGVTGSSAETTAGSSAGILPTGTDMTVANPTDTTLTLTFATYGGAIQTDVPFAFAVTNGVGGVTGTNRETVKGTAPVTGWATGGTATIANLYSGTLTGDGAPSIADEGFRLTLSGTPGYAGINVANTVSVTNGTGGTTGTGAETRTGTPPGVTFRGMTIIDISDPLHPDPIIGVPMCGNSHTQTKYFDMTTNKLLVFGTSSGTTTQPQWGLNTCSAPAGREEVVEIPLDHPENAFVRVNGYIPVGFNGACHDVNVFEELHLLTTACSGGGGASAIDVTDTYNTQVKWTFTWPGLATTHSAAISWNGRYVYINGEPGGGGGAECAYDDDTVKPLIHILDRITGKVVGQWMLPRPQWNNSLENCTTHTVSMIPSLDHQLMAWSGYTAGVSVIDFTNPKAPREIAFVDQITENATSGLGCWTGYWYNDNLYCNELNWGQHVFTVNEPWWKQALNMTELNPQTATKLIRCQVSFTGGPTKAKKNGTVNVNVKVFGPAPLQAAWGALVEIRAPGYYKAVKTGEAGTASATVKAANKGKLSVTVPAMENMIGCSAPSKNIAKPATKKAKKAKKSTKAVKK